MGAIVLDTGMSPREVEAMTWWDLADINEAKRQRAQQMADHRRPARKPSVVDLSGFGGGILPGPPEE